MADYQFLTDDDKARIIAEVRASQGPTADELQRVAEEAHFKETVRFATGVAEEAPAPFEIPAEITGILELDQKIEFVAGQVIEGIPIEAVPVELPVEIVNP